MSVVSGGRIIFCEGKETSLDSQLIDQILTGIAGEKYTIIPVGGKFNVSVFVNGYFSRNRGIDQKYLIFRDRDFDVSPTDNSQLLEIPQSRSTFLTHRACIENYLLDADLIHRYWCEKYAEKLDSPKTSKWGYKNSPGLPAINQWIETSARRLQFYQAVRWALGDLCNQGAARKQLKTTWTGKSGHLPSSLELEDCVDEAVQIVNSFKQNVESITTEFLEDRINFYCQSFSQEEFWSQKQYLIWFHGKDLRKQMQRQEPLYLSLYSESFIKWVLPQIDLNQHPDLMELRNRLEQL
ncbi:DUF4435 domain-containing protein [Laspinema olomoucense]|uniref:DUF4435 domain-containing protein n=1 Tax=Laspinema olomoucense TaxID=3231600 RepID=UPI0021BB3143|nr:DUF4435 domain-containing protein [Laspinema sp. D3d]MCT7971945.1 DUF4435 domain-containing protein [Laspinema sp. D3d]